jgi:Na+-driven multidrug efflux pump
MGMSSSFFYQGIGKGTISLVWTIIREVIFTVGFTYLLGIVLNMGLLGIWIGLAVGRVLASILNFIYARYTIGKLKKTFDGVKS